VTLTLLPHLDDSGIKDERTDEHKTEQPADALKEPLDTSAFAAAPLCWKARDWENTRVTDVVVSHDDDDHARRIKKTWMP
jgi:hypothetical protein